MLVDSEKLGSNQAMSEAEKMQRERKGTVSLKGIVTYDWSSDGKSILVPLDGVLYLAGVDGSVKVANGTGKGEMLNSVLSEKGKELPKVAWYYLAAFRSRLGAMRYWGSSASGDPSVQIAKMYSDG